MKRAALVLLDVTLPAAPLREVMKTSLEDPRARAFLGVLDANGERRRRFQRRNGRA